MNAKINSKRKKNQIYWFKEFSTSDDHWIKIRSKNLVIEKWLNVTLVLTSSVK